MPSLQRLTLTGITIDPEKKDKNGKSYRMVRVGTNDGRKMSCFVRDPKAPELSLEEGKEYAVLVDQNGQYWNFKLAPKTALLDEKIDTLQVRVDKSAQVMSDVLKRLENVEKFLVK